MDCKYNYYSDIENVFCPVHYDDQKSNIDYHYIKPQKIDIIIIDAKSGAFDSNSAEKHISPIRYTLNRGGISHDMLHLMNIIPDNFRTKLYLIESVFEEIYLKYVLNNNKTFDFKQQILLYDESWQCSACSYDQNIITMQCKICCNPSPSIIPFYLHIKTNYSGTTIATQSEDDYKYIYSSSSSSSSSSEILKEDFSLKKPSIGDYIDKDVIIALPNNQLKALHFESAIISYNKWFGEISKYDMNQINEWFDNLLKEKTPNC